jgi:hypothetical protein
MSCFMPRAGFKPWSSLSLPPEFLGLQAWAIGASPDLTFKCDSGNPVTVPFQPWEDNLIQWPKGWLNGHFKKVAVSNPFFWAALGPRKDSHPNHLCFWGGFCSSLGPETTQYLLGMDCVLGEVTTFLPFVSCWTLLDWFFLQKTWWLHSSAVNCSLHSTKARKGIHPLPTPPHTFCLTNRVSS